MATYAKSMVGADTLRRTTYKEFPLGTTEFGEGNKAMVYGQAAVAVSAGACDIDLGSGVISSGSGYTADAGFAPLEYGWVHAPYLKGVAGADQTVIPFYGVSANGGDAAVVTIVAPFAFSIARIDTVLLGGALATGDFTLTAAIDGNAVTNGVVTITQASSTAGDKDNATPSAANTGAAGATITLTGGGTSTGNRTINGFVTLERT